MNWQIEHIPDSDHVYRRVHVNFFITYSNFEVIPPSAFRDNNGISVDWEKYTTPEEKRARESKKNGIIKIQAGIVRKYRNLTVDHSPLNENRAHSNIIGLNLFKKVDQTDIRKRLARSSEIVLKPDLV